MAFPSFDLIASWYPKNWDINRVAMAVKCKRVTEEQYKQLTGFTYPATSGDAPKSESTTPVQNSESASQAATQSQSASTSAAQSTSSSTSAPVSAPESVPANDGKTA